MKGVLNFFYFIMIAASMLLVSSCGDDEDPIVIDPGSEGVNVADGLYLAVSGDDPVSSAILSSEVVEAEGFATQARPGFTAGYMWLESGNYNVVQIANKEVTATIGGSAETVTDEGSGCDYNSYTVVSTSEGGAAFAATTGLHLVTHDQMTNELILYKIESPNIIGNATEGGWSTDVNFTGAVSDEGGSWSATDVILRGGEFKLRFNCRWGINRRVDPNGSLDDAANGYQVFTNFGGTTSSLAAGASNFQQEEDAVYTVTVDWTPRNGWAISTERTGDAPVIAFNPNDFNMGVIGDATAGGWDGDQDLFYKAGDGGVHNWAGVVTLAEAGEMKFRANDAWDFNLGGDLAGLTAGGDNIPTLGEGDYYIVLTTADDGDTWSATVNEFGWGVIGEGGPNGDWENDVEMTADGFVDGVTTYSVTGDFGTAGWKFRGGQDWLLNVGGDFSFLTLDGDNLTMPAAGNYTVVLSFDGSVYSAVATAN